MKQSVWSRFGYWAQNCYPSQTVSAAALLDDGLRDLLEMTVGLRVPRGRDPDTIVIETTIPGREELSFSDWVIRQPVKCGGMGLRAYVETCAPAFIGAVELAIPSL